MSLKLEVILALSQNLEELKIMDLFKNVMNL